MRARRSGTATRAGRWHRRTHPRRSCTRPVGLLRRLPGPAAVPDSISLLGDPGDGVRGVDAVADLTLHPPTSGWNCATCHEQWPCLGARGALLIEYADARAALGMYLAVQMTDFITATRGVFDVPTHDRFVGWVRPSEPPPAWMSTAPVVAYRPTGERR